MYPRCPSFIIRGIHFHNDDAMERGLRFAG